VQRLFRRDARSTSGTNALDDVVDVSVQDAMTFSRSTNVSVELCMISTPDGVTDVAGRSGPLGGPIDQEVFLTLRSHADVVLVGAGTVRAEQYKAPVRAPLPIVVVTRSCALDFDSPLFTSGWGMLATTVDAPDTSVRMFRAGKIEVDLASIIQQLRTELNARVIHVEGGPDLNASLLQHDLVDAINLTMSPFVGKGGSAITSRRQQNAMPQFRRFKLTQLCRDGDFLFARYERSKQQI
jgi:riboflavin biosynthesis pyrimidine reductase